MSSSIKNSFVLNDFDRFNIDYSKAEYIDEILFPKSYVFLSKKTGSRTIVNINRNFPELKAESLLKLKLDPYEWIHFEV